MKHSTLSLVAILAVLVSAVACADTVRLKSGMTLEGQILEEDTTAVILQVGGSKMTLKRELIEKIDRSGSSTPGKTDPQPGTATTTVNPAVEAQYQELLKSLKESDAQAQFDLATWCRDNKLTAQALDHLRKAATCSPPHPKAKEEAAKLGGFLVRGGLYTAEQILSPNAPVMTDAQRHQVWEDIVAYASIDAAQKMSLISQLSVTYEEQERWKDVERLWPRYAELAISRARTANMYLTAETVGTILKNNPSGVYEVRPPEQVAEGLDLEKLRPALRKLDVTPGKHALARPGVLDAAIQDLALLAAVQGKKLLNKADMLLVTDPDTAFGKLLPEAEKVLAYAEQLQPGIGRPLMAEGVRKRLGALQSKIEQELKDCDTKAPWNHGDYWYWMDSGRFTSESQKLWRQRTAEALESCGRALDLVQQATKVPREYIDDLKPDLLKIQQLGERAVDLRTRLKSGYGRDGRNDTGSKINRNKPPP